MDAVILYVAVTVLFALSAVKDRAKTKRALLKGLAALENILPQLLVVLVFVALVLAAFNAETISRLLGDRSGWIGVLLAAVAGSVTLIPGFVAFPAAGELLRNGAGTLQVAAFVSSLMMVGVITLPVEIKFFGRRAAIARNLLAFAFCFAAASFVAWAVSL